MKPPLYFLLFACTVLSGCLNAPDSGLMAKLEAPRRGRVASFVLIEEFLRATYCPTMTDYKIEVNPSYKDLPGMPHAEFDATLTAGMARMLKKEGLIYVEMRFEDFDGSSTYPAYFFGLFDRKTGELDLFDRKGTKPSGVSGLYVAIINRKDFDTVFLDVEPGESFITERGFEVLLKKSEKLFHVVAPSMWTD